ncbi:ClpP-like prohead protease/major capsid protein fusion protein [Thioalkalivibrio sp. ALE11]|uniref:ClpP-like prohead protease/major capsid protein fusion protein n=1 Tax=Thioalkalivibrio sp. ALE11 TaxID=1265494 RepID=UPI0003618B34|nr:ClpP-like prohead protease/major capsid protein fusion protein [Thioalkalivibrio sp. ALE11]
MNKIHAFQNGGLEILVYEDISDGFARDIVEQLAGHTGPVTLRINSPGGAVSETLAAYNALVQHPGRVVVYVDGLAASSASLLAMAGAHTVMAENALMMIHDPWVFTGGNSEELRRLADTLDKHRDVMVEAYRRKSGMSARAVTEIMQSETWFTAEEALQARFIDEIQESPAIAASLDLSRFNLPDRIKNMSTDNTQQNHGSEGANPAAHNPDPVALERQRIQRRNETIRARFKPFMDRDDVRAMYDDLIVDPEVTAEAAVEKLLAKLGEGAEPINPQGFAPPVPDMRGGTNSHAGEFSAAVTDSILMRYGVPVQNPHPAVRDVRGMGVDDICASILSQNGKTTRGKSKAEIVQAAMTTSDLPALMEGIASKALMTGFQESEAASHREWTREGQLPDFKEARRAALSEAPALKEVAEGAEYTYGAVSDASETIKLSTYGRIVKLSRHALINDDIGELARLPLAMGQAAARTEAHNVYSLLTDNPDMRDGKPLFHSDHSNEGTAAKPDIESLGEARKLMRLQKGIAGAATLNIVPRFLIVPAALETIAEQLLVSIAPAQTGHAVPDWMRNLAVVVDSRLDEASETAWYLAASPDQHDTVEVARLDGNGAESFTQEDFATDNMSFKIRLDTGAAVLDWRALVRNQGA